MRNLTVYLCYHNVYDGFTRQAYGQFSTLSEAKAFKEKINGMIREEMKNIPAGFRIRSKNLPYAVVGIVLDVDADYIRADIKEAFRLSPYTRKG
jgi:hypothetical protein